MAFVYEHGKFEGELGYHITCKQAEKVKLAKTWVEGPLLAMSSDTDGKINYAQTINNLFSSSSIAATRPGGDLCIKESLLDLASAAHPGVFSQKIYLSLGGKWDDREFPLFIGTGASYEMSSQNTALNRWNLWAKGGFSF